MPAPKLVAPPVLAQVNASVDVFLHRVANWLAGLPGNNVTTFLEGALLMVRRTLFNQAPNVSPIQETTTSEGLILGSLGAVDPDAAPDDGPLTYTVVKAPQTGSVEVTEFGEYTFTPRQDYAGSDSFTVKVATAQPGFNILTWSDGSQEVTVQVGSGAATHPFLSSVPDAIDAALYLEQATATITVDRQVGLLGSRYVAKVALDGVSGATELEWMDARGRSGVVSVGELLDDPVGGATSGWDEFAQAAERSNDGVMIGIDFDDADGVRTTVILTNVAAEVDSGGRYVFTGQLAANPDEQPDIDVWDVIGPSFKDSYENFLKTYIQVSRFQPVTLEVAGADLYASTSSPATYANLLAGADLGVSAKELGLGNPVSSASVTAADVSNESDNAVTAMIPYGDGYFAVGLKDGMVKQRTVEGWEVLQDTAWNSPVTQMVAYGGGLVAGLGNGSVQQWTGSAWNELKCGYCGDNGFNSKVDAMLAYGDGFVVGLNNGSVQQWTGTEWKELHAWQTLGSPGPKFDDGSNTDTLVITNTTNMPLVFTGMPEEGSILAWSAPKNPIAAGTVLAPGGSLSIELRRGYLSGYVNKTNWAVRSWSGEPEPGVGEWSVSLTSSGSLTTNSSVASCSGSCGPIDRTSLIGGNLTVNLTDGRPYTESGQPYIQTMLPYRDGFVVGLYDGSIQYWTGSGGWIQLKDTGWGSPVRSAIGEPGGDSKNSSGFIVGLGNGSVQRWSPVPDPPAPGGAAYQSDGSWGNWNELKCGFCGDNGFNSAVQTMLPIRNGFVVGLQNGSVQRWTGNAGTTGRWQQLQGTGWDSPVTHMVSRPVMDGVDAENKPVTYDRFVVSLNDGSVQQWTGTDWEELNPKQSKDLLSADDLKMAVAQAIAGTEFTKSSLFQKATIRPACYPNCDGYFYPMTLTSELVPKNDATGAPAKLKPYQLASKTIILGDNGQTLDLSYDVSHVVYGYAYVPPGFWGKFNLKNYAGAFVLALPTGPSVKLNLAGSATFNKEVELLNKDYSWTTVYGVFELNASMKAELEVTLDLPERDKTATISTIQDDTRLTDDQRAALLALYNSYLEKPLSAHAYFVPGLLMTYNTDSFDGVAFGADYYTDINYDDFKAITGVEIKPTLTPSVSGKYGIFGPKGTPIIEDKSIAAVSLGYENPVEADLVLKKGQDPSLIITSTGKLKYGAELLPDLTDALSFDDTLDIYSYTSKNLLADAPKSAV